MRIGLEAIGDSLHHMNEMISSHVGAQAGGEMPLNGEVREMITLLRVNEMMAGEESSDMRYVAYMMKCISNASCEAHEWGILEDGDVKCRRP